MQSGGYKTKVSVSLSRVCRTVKWVPYIEREREKREIIDLSLGRARVLIKVASLLLLKVEEIL